MIKSEEKFFQFFIFFFPPLTIPHRLSFRPRPRGKMADSKTRFDHATVRGPWSRGRANLFAIVNGNGSPSRDAVAKKGRGRRRRKKRERRWPLSFPFLRLSLSLSRKVSRTVYKQFTCPGRLKKRLARTILKQQRRSTSSSSCTILNLQKKVLFSVMNLIENRGEEEVFEKKKEKRERIYKAEYSHRP